ncbi:MAG TPA: hypothetical protein VEK15_13500, partial [Vicinamibacteria bacterium]|nr:hypothetical protein [Vicinamibacteria bacterium]
MSRLSPANQWVLPFAFVPVLTFVASVEASERRAASTSGSFENRSPYRPSTQELARIEKKLDEAKEKLPRPHTDAAAAVEFFRQKRVPVGQQEVPVDRYFTAREHLRAMRRYSTASNRFLPSSGDEDLDFPGASSSAALGVWTWLGPGNVGGRTRGLVIDPSNPQRMYAAGVAGGVWKTTNAGATWAALDDFMASLAVSSLAMAPGNPSILYAGTGEGFFNDDAVRGAGIFKSTDAGATWNRLPSTESSDFFYVNDIVVSSNNSQRIYAATRAGVHRSLDGGANWSLVLAPLVTGGCLDLAARTDGGPVDIVFASCGTLTQATVYRNLDASGAGVWTSVLTEANMGRTSLAIAPSNQDIIYALSASIDGTSPYDGGLHAVFRSINGGSTWAARVRNTDATKLNTLLLTNPLLATLVECALDTSSTFVNQGEYDNVIAVDPLDPDIVWVGGIDLFRSDDGGANWGVASYWWSNASPSFAHADQHALAFHPEYNGNTNTVLYVGNDGGLFRTDVARAATATGPLAVCDPANSGVGFTELNNNYGVTQFYHGVPYSSGTRYLGGSQDNGTLRGDDASGSEAWSMIHGGDGGYVAVDPSNTNVLYAETTGISIQKSIDGGASFDPATGGIADIGLFITPFVMDPSESFRLWTGGSFLWRTNNGAATWSRASAAVLDGKVSCIAVSPVNSNKVLAGTSSGHIHRTDSGLTSTASTSWPVTRPREGFLSSLTFHPTDENVAFATYSTFGGTHVWKSTDGGANWSPLDGSGGASLPDIPVHKILVDPLTEPIGDRAYLATDLGVFVSTDGGLNWAVENTGFANVITEALSLDASQKTLFAFTHGRGVFRVDTTGAIAVDVLSVDFESGAQGFVADSVNGFLTWQLTTNRGTEEGHSPSTSFYFGDPENFDYNSLVIEHAT